MTWFSAMKSLPDITLGAHKQWSGTKLSIVQVVTGLYTWPEYNEKQQGRSVSLAQKPVGLHIASCGRHRTNIPGKDIIKAAITLAYCFNGSHSRHCQAVITSLLRVLFYMIYEAQLVYKD